MHPFGRAMVAAGGVVVLLGGSVPVGIAVASLGAITWMVGAHANTAIALSLDIGLAGLIGGEAAHEAVLEDIEAYGRDLIANATAAVSLAGCRPQPSKK